jgi:hypothetical protein
MSVNRLISSAIVSNEAGSSMIKPAFVRGVMAAIVITYSFVGLTSDKPAKASAPLSSDEVAIYQAILTQQNTKESSPLNVATTTVPFAKDSATNDCLQDIKLENVPAVSHSFHELTEEVVSKTDARLVNPKEHSKIAHANDPEKTMKEGKSVDDAVRGAFASGLFSMSEIAFDKERRYAVVSYSFWCGTLCGQGATVLFKKVNGVWRAERYCTRWIS